MASVAEDNSPGAEASLQGLPSALLGRILERLPVSCSASVALACRALADSVRDEEALWKSLALRGEGEHAHDAPPDPMAELPAGMPSWRAYVELLHCQRVFMSVSGEIEESGRVVMAGPKKSRMVKIKDVVPEPPEPGRDLYGIHHVSVSTISWHNRIACAGVTSTGQLMLWETLAIPGDHDLPEPTFEAPEMSFSHGRALPWHTECYPDDHKDMGKVASCYVDKLVTWAITQEGDLYSANSGTGSFPFVKFERCTNIQCKVKQLVSVTPIQYESNVGRVVAALDTDGQVWVWGWLDGVCFYDQSVIGARQMNSLFGGVANWQEFDDDEQDEDADIEITDARRLKISGLKPGEVIASLASGNQHFVAVSSAGRVFCWGYNDNYQCCWGEIPCVEFPMLVHLDPDCTVIKAAAGDHHTILLTSTGVVLGFGQCRGGQLWPTTRNEYLGRKVDNALHPRNLCLHREFPTLGPAVDICAGGEASIVVCASGKILLLGAQARHRGQIIDTPPLPYSAAACLAVATTGRDRQFQVVVAVAGPGKTQGCHQGSGPDMAPPAHDDVAECTDSLAGASLEEEPRRGTAAAAAQPRPAYSPDMLQKIFGHSGAESVWRPEWWASPCEWCGGEGSLRCTQCQIARYCCREHQKKAWTEHKRECRHMKIIKKGKS